MFYETDLIDNQDLRKITRITVVTDEGREFEKYNAFENGIILSIQDGGKTLKIFPGQKREKPSNAVIKKGHADWADLKGKNYVRLDGRLRRLLPGDDVFTYASFRRRPKIPPLLYS